jgi:hypothetical protein
MSSTSSTGNHRARVRIWLSVALARAGSWQRLTSANWDQIDLGDPFTLAADIEAYGPFPPGAMEAMQRARSRVFAGFWPVAAAVGSADSDADSATPPTRGLESPEGIELPDFGVEAAASEPPASAPVSKRREAYPRVDAPDVVVIDQGAVVHGDGLRDLQEPDQLESVQALRA